jgi:hypothetical protein
MKSQSAPFVNLPVFIPLTNKPAAMLAFLFFGELFFTKLLFDQNGELAGSCYN